MRHSSVEAFIKMQLNVIFILPDDSISKLLETPVVSHFSAVVYILKTVISASFISACIL